MAGPSIHSLSGLANSSIVEWRKNSSQEEPAQYYFKLFSAQTAFGVFAVISTIELVAYAILSAASILVSPISNSPFRFFISLTADSLTACIAINTNFFYHNLFGTGNFSTSLA